MLRIKKIIVVTGYCATGKSTFANKLSQDLNIPCFSKDTLKEAMAEGFGSNSKELHDKGSAAVVNMMLHLLECCLKADNPCILEANFRLFQGEQIKALVEKYNAECITFLFTGDLNVLYHRYIERVSVRHWVHEVVGEDKDFFIQGHLNSKMGEVNIGQVINIDATDFQTINYDELITIAKDFIN